MKRYAPVALALTLLAAAPALRAQTSDRELLRQADFSRSIVTEQPPEGAGCCGRAMYSVRRQLTGRDVFDPPAYMFFGQAVKQLGLVPAVFATADRLLRDSRIGTVLAHLEPDDPYIHEGPEAYIPEKRRGER